MPPLLSKPSSAAPATLFYITVGALMTVWSGIWFLYMRDHPPAHQSLNYVCWGFLMTGIVLLVIGFVLGPLSRWARHAELPPNEVTAPVVQTEQTAARRS